MLRHYEANIKNGVGSMGINHTDIETRVLFLWKVANYLEDCVLCFTVMI